MKRFMFAVFVSALGLGIPNQVSAIDDVFKAIRPSLKLDHTVGLDEDTRRLLEDYPPKVRVELIKALKEALPLIDASVLKYLQSVDRIWAGQLRLGACLIGGIGKSFAEEVGNQIPFKGATRPHHDLRAYQDELLTALDKDSAPFKYVDSYADIMTRAGATACQVEASGATASLPLLYEIHANARMRFDLWYRIKDLCRNAPDCLRFVRNQVADHIEKADRRDSSQVGAAERFGKLVLPGDGIFDRFNRDSYERPMLELVSIQRDLRVATLVRETKSQMLLDSANAELKKLNEVVVKARGRLYHPGNRYNAGQIRNAREGNAKAKDLVEPVPLNLERADSMVTAAVAGNSALGASASEWRSCKEKLLADVGAVRKSADDNLADASQLVAEERFKVDQAERRMPR